MRSPRLSAACRRLVPAVHAATDGAALLDWVRAVQATDQWTSFDAYHRTTDTLVDLYERHGAAVEVHSMPTGTHAGTGRWVITEAADQVAATLELVAPRRERLATLAQDPWLVPRWSNGTPRGGLTLPLAVCDDLAERDRLGPIAFAGRAVLTRATLGHQGRRWANSGAPVVIYESNCPNDPEARTWASFGWGGVPHRDGAARPAALSISRRLGTRLRELLAAGPVELFIEVDVRHYAGSHDLVCGLVRGAANPQDELWVLAHSQEPGALDNASGVALTVGIAAALERLIAAGALARPKRTIRLLNAYECYGFFHYAEHVGRLQPALAGVCLDSLGLRPELCGRTIGWRSTIPMSAQFVNLVGERFLRAALAVDNPGYRLSAKPFVPTSDNLLGDPRYGFPCPWLESYANGRRPYDAYHTSADQPDLLEPRALRLLTAAMAGYLYYLADAETADAVELAGLEAERLRRQADRRESSRAEAAYLRDQLEASLSRLARWFWAGDRSRALAALDEHRRRLAEALPAATRRRPSGDIPRRTAFLSPTPENTPGPLADRIAAAGLPPWALFWADGERDPATIADRLSVEFGRAIAPAEVEAYFAAHADLGYVALQAAGEAVTQAQLVRDLRALGLGAGMDVVVHGSLSAMGHVLGGASTVIEALLAVLGSRGTLLLPSFNHAAAEVYGAAFTPTTNGAVAEAFWRRADVVRSDHPTHAVAARGPRAEAYCAGHTAAGVWAAESPLGRLAARGGWVLLLGVDWRSATAYHLAEAARGVPCLDPFGSVEYVIDEAGRRREVRGLAWRNGPCPVDPAGIEPLLAGLGGQRAGEVGRAPARLARARDVAAARDHQLGGRCATCPVRPVPRERGNDGRRWVL